MAIKAENGFWLDKKGDAVHPDNIRATEKIKDETVENLISKAVEVQTILSVFKKNSFDEVESYFNLLLQNYGVDNKKNTKKGNITIENFSGTAKVQIAVNDNIAFDEKLSIAKMKIDEYLHEITKDTHADIQTLITKSFEVDKKGEVNAKKILALRGYEITHPLWIEAMQIISEATEVVSSKSYIRFYTRESIDKEYKQVSLDLAGA